MVGYCFERSDWFTLSPTSPQERKNPGQYVSSALVEYYRISPDSLDCTATTPDFNSGDVGFFQFGKRNICYGRCVSGVARDLGNVGQFDASRAVRCDGKSIRLPFCFTDTIENLRLERYRERLTPKQEILAASELVRKLYYSIRGWLPDSVRAELQKAYFHDWRKLRFPAWPVDTTIDRLHEELLRLLMEANGKRRVPFIWFWPKGAPSCLIMTHDVETCAGRDFTPQLMDLDDSYGMKGSFQVIPEERYDVSDKYVSEIRGRGFEFNIHDLNHDGHLYRERREFLRRAAKINSYVHQYGSKGFRAGAMYRNQDWYDVFEFSYDMSVPNVAHLEPMRGGCCTVMPYFVGKIVELPLTMVQDYSLFHILDDYSINLWKKQMALIRERNGLISFITHPDYLIEPRARDVYRELLDFLRETIECERIWAALPGDVDLWWRARSQMELVPEGNDWKIVGPESSRARVAYAVLDGEQVVYELASPEHSKLST